jgi:hypothetical protein
MVADLELDSKAKSSIVRSASFDRKELRFRVVETDGRNAQADLRGVLMALPRDFQRTPADFYTPAGRHTFSGIVFTSFAKSRVGGVLDLRDQVKQATGASVTIYAGGAPHPGFDKRAWDEEKRANANRFMQNEATVLVATKASGMGIDKANTDVANRDEGRVGRRRVVPVRQAPRARSFHLAAGNTRHGVTHRRAACWRGSTGGIPHGASSGQVSRCERCVMAYIYNTFPCMECAAQVKCARATPA